MSWNHLTGNVTALESPGMRYKCGNWWLVGVFNTCVTQPFHLFALQVYAN